MASSFWSLASEETNWSSVSRALLGGVFVCVVGSFWTVGVGCPVGAGIDGVFCILAISMEGAEMKRKG